MKRILVQGWLLAGLVQFFALVGGLVDAIGGIGYILGFVVAEISILGTVLGVRGAINVWGWSIGAALTLFVGAPILLILMSMLAGRRD